jgi:anaerobic selenocysteine-containing dehydrogenase
VAQPPQRPPQPPLAGGGLPVIEYWAERTLSPQGPKIWQTLLHKSACLSCAWGTGGQKGGFVNEDGKTLQRCAKSVEAIAAELQPAVPESVFTSKSIDELQQLTSLAANNLGRLSFPMILRAGKRHYERIGWDEVYTIVTTAMQQSPERVASYSSGRSSNEAAFLLQLMLRALGSNNLADCSDLCHAASTIGLRQMFGSGTSMVSLADLKKTDCVVLIGSNAPANHPRLMNELIQLRDRGGRVIVINPTIEVGLVKFASPAYPVKSMLSGGSAISSLYLQPIPGSDTALFVGIQKALWENKLIDFDYLQAHTEGWESVIEQAQNTPWKAIIATCGVTKSDIKLAAQMIGRSEKVIFAWAMGVTQQENGVDNVYSIANTALITGNAGKEGAGTMPIRGHSNVQGFGSMGVTIHLRESIQATLEKLLDKPLSPVKIPVFARFENPHQTTVESGNNFVRLNDAGETHLKKADLISEVEFLAELADRLHGNDPVNWRQLQNPEYVRQLIAQTIPGYDKIGTIDQTKTEFTIAGRIFHQPQFPTPSGKAKMFVTPLPPLKPPDLADFGLAGKPGAIALILGTGRSYGQHNTVVYNNADKYRNMPDRNCILLNRLDAESVGLSEYDKVTVQGDVGKLEQVRIIYGQIRRGAAMMFYPEVNVIFSAKIDLRCGTPAFKRVPIVVYA